MVYLWVLLFVCLIAASLIMAVEVTTDKGEDLDGDVDGGH